MGIAISLTSWILTISVLCPLSKAATTNCVFTLIVQENTYVDHEGNALLTCDVETSVNLSTYYFNKVWLKNGTQIYTTYRIQGLGSNGSPINLPPDLESRLNHTKDLNHVTLVNVTSDDLGNYACDLQTLATPGCNTSSVAVPNPKPFSLSKPTPLTKNQIQVREIGSLHALECLVYSVKPAATIQWSYSNGTFISSNINETTTSNSDNTFNTTSRLENIGGIIKPNTEYFAHVSHVSLPGPWNFSIRTLERPYIFPLLQNASWSTMKGLHNIFNCTAFGYPSPSITWYFKGETVGNDSQLFIKDIDKEDEGWYQCKASSEGFENQDAYDRAYLAVDQTTTPTTSDGTTDESPSAGLQGWHIGLIVTGVVIIVVAFIVLIVYWSRKQRPIPPKIGSILIQELAKKDLNSLRIKCTVSSLKPVDKVSRLNEVGELITSDTVRKTSNQISDEKFITTSVLPDATPGEKCIIKIELESEENPVRFKIQLTGQQQVIEPDNLENTQGVSIKVEELPETKLQCTVPSAKPAATIAWLDDKQEAMELEKSGIKETSISNSDGTFSTTSDLPNISPGKTYTVRVDHEALKQPIEFEIKPTGEIQVFYPVENENVTLNKGGNVITPAVVHAQAYGQQNGRKRGKSEQAMSNPAYTSDGKDQLQDIGQDTRQMKRSSYSAHQKNYSQNWSTQQQPARQTDHNYASYKDSERHSHPYERMQELPPIGHHRGVFKAQDSATPQFAFEDEYQASSSKNKNKKRKKRTKDTENKDSLSKKKRKKRQQNKQEQDT